MTGSTGFVGSVLCDALCSKGHEVFRAVRSIKELANSPSDALIAVGDINASTDWTKALAPSSASGNRPVDAVIHCAARAHVMNEGSQVEAAFRYRETNVDGTAGLAQSAAAIGVKAFVFVSSIKVNGESTQRESSFAADHPPMPEDDYGKSKWQAEEVLWDIAQSSNLGVTVVRPPLIYGPGVKGNLARLLSAVYKGIPLPLGSIDNLRSMIGLGNLVGFLIHCLAHPNAPGKTFLVSDPCALSTREVVRLMAEGMNRPNRMVPIPVSILRSLGHLLGKKNEVDRLVGSLCIDDSFARAELGWNPPYSAEQGIREMAADFLRARNAKHD